ncbi:MAG: tetratricopeptide repeat protein, partial [Bacteroidetes bacterium]|nr:tetratricopeptide repeat protein [Bacteroidota bacterium]
MAKKKPTKQKFTKTAVVTEKPKGQVASRPVVPSKWLILAAVAITFLVYIPSLNNGFIPNWDDGGYVLKYDPVKEINAENLTEIFSVFYKGNYHPLTTLFYALEYQLVGPSPFLYHFNNLILHLLNVWLVFLLIWRLVRRNDIAFITALLFGVHTMHVESVAWISERKDVLYTFFYLAGLLYYISYFSKETAKRKNYLIALLLMLLSMLSKSAAVAFPLSLLVIDYFFKRKITLLTAAEKVPFFAISMVFGITAILSQGSAGAIQDLDPMFTYFERGLLASYGLMLYFMKLVAPTDLSAMHPYPIRMSEMLPAMYYVAPFVVLAVSAIIFFLRKKSRILLFGALFFLVNIVLVLQILPVGAAIIAERYTYVPYIGLFFIIGYVISLFSNKEKPGLYKIRIPVYILAGVWMAWVSWLTVDRIGVWKRGDILFIDVTKKYPTMPFAFNNLGYYYYEDAKNNRKALEYFNKCISLDTTFHQAFSNRGILYFNAPVDELRTILKDTSANLQIKRFYWAIDDFTRAIRHKPTNKDAWIGRANAYSEIGKFEEAINDYDQYLTMKPEDISAWKWRGTAKFRIGRFKEAEQDFIHAGTMDPEDAEVFYWKGLIIYQDTNYTEAIKYFDESLKRDRKKGEVYSWRGLAKYNLRDFVGAIADYNQAIAANPNDVAAIVNRSVSKKETGDLIGAFEDIEKARLMGYPVNGAYYNELLSIGIKAG